MDFAEMAREAGGIRNLLKIARESESGVEKRLEQTFGEESGFFRKAGFRVSKIGEGEAEITFPFSKLVARRGNILHGGAVMYALDTAGGLAAMTVNRGVDQVTMELKTNFLMPAKSGPFAARAVVIRPGRTAITVEADLKDSGGNVCAKAIGTWFALYRKSRATDKPSKDR